MSFQIRKIVLYGPVEEPRVVDFRPGEMNIITGASKTGKSALISIVDYCLGATECGVAYGPIRDTTEWYAVLLSKPGQEVFVARRAPQGVAPASSAFFVEVGSSVDIPEKSAIRANTNLEAVVAMLSTFAGIGDYVHEPPDGQTRAPIAATVRHALFFCFQPQDEIINRKQLFYRQGEPFIPQSIKDVLPYFLGAIDDQHVIKAARLRQLRTELRRLARKLEEAAALRGGGSMRAGQLLTEAAHLGLVAQLPEPIEADAAVELLQAVLDRELPTLPEFDANADAAEYEALMAERSRLTTELRVSERDLSTARALLRERAGYSAETAEQAGRLRSIGLIPDGPHEQTCPLCASAIDAMPGPADLRASLEALDARLVSVTQENPHLEALAADLEQRARDSRSQLADNRRAVDQLQRTRAEVARYRDFIGRAAHVRGRISIYLESLPQVEPDIDATGRRAQEIALEIAQLEGDVNADAVQERIESLLNLVSRDVSEAAKYLELEHSDHPVRLSLKQLTVIADTPTATIPMDKMGSGANWVGYHIAVHLALHTLFTRAARPVPRFLFLDQPSQVYFPADVDSSGRLEVVREGRKLDEDRAAVLRMFEIIRDVVASLGGAFQVIVTEHADPDQAWYQQSVVERWRDGNALIPQAWIDHAVSDAGE